MKILIFLIFTLFVKLNVYGFSKEDSLLDLLNKTKSLERIKIYNSLAEIYAANNPEKVRENAIALKKYAEEIKYPEGIGNAYFYIGNMLLDQGKYDDSKANFDSAHTYFLQTDNKERISALTNGYGSIYFLKGELGMATKYFLRASRISEEIKDYKGLANITNNLGLIFIRQNNYNEALLYFQKSLDAHLKVGNKNGQGNTLNNIAMVYTQKKDFINAEKFIKSAIHIWESINDLNGLAMSLNGFGSIYLSKEDKNSALVYFEKSFNICKETGNKFGMAQNLQCIADIWLQNKKIDKAKLVYIQCSEIASEIGNIQQQITCFQKLYEICNEQGDLKNALNYHVLYTERKDSMLNQESNKQIIEMQTKYETNNKEKEIQLLTKDKELKNIRLKKNTIIIYSISIGLLLVLILTFGILRAYKQKQKVNKLLILQKSEIAEKNKELKNQNEEIRNQRDEIEAQRNIVVNQKEEIIGIHNELTDSINYAKKIQEAMLPDLEKILNFKFLILNDESNLEIQHSTFKIQNFFVLFKPKDIVSGDFYWMEKVDDLLFFAVADCTGHGVPGAFMSMIGTTLLNEILNEKKIKIPSEMLHMLNYGIKISLKQENEASAKDGMDIALCSVNITTKMLTFAGANRNLYFLRNNELIEIKSNRVSIGGFTDNSYSFKNNEIELGVNDIIYLFTDGFEDQFGGLNRKKFLSRNLKNLLTANSQKQMADQKILLENVHNEWKGNNEQTDDITIMGIKV